MLSLNAQAGPVHAFQNPVQKIRDTEKQPKHFQWDGVQHRISGRRGHASVGSLSRA